MRQVGRPKEENPKDQKVTVRLTKEERDNLTDYTHETNQSITQVVSEALKLLYEKREKERK